MTSVAVTVPAILSVSGSPITSSGTFAITTAVTPTGTGAIVLASSPTITTPNITTSLTFNRVLSNKKLVLWESVPALPNDHQFYGFGVNTNILRYQVPSSTVDHVFYAGASTTTSTEIFRISGGGDITSAGSATFNSLTASYSVHTNASKSLVSVQNIGTGLNVLQTSPTLVTPLLGDASGTSLNLSNSSITSFEGLLIENNYAATGSGEAGVGITLSTTSLAHSSRMRQEITDETTNSFIIELSQASNPFLTGISFTVNTLGIEAFIPGILNLSSLTASYSVHTDASKNLVSVQNIGTGLNILQISPTLITPILGVASGTSLNLSGLTASYSVHTDASKNLVSVQNSGTGLNILQTSPTLISPVLGAASGTSLNLSGLTASRLLLTDVSKNLVSLASAGSNGNVLTVVAGSPTWAAPATVGN